MVSSRRNYSMTVRLSPDSRTASGGMLQLSRPRDLQLQEALPRRRRTPARAEAWVRHGGQCLSVCLGLSVLTGTRKCRSFWNCPRRLQRGSTARPGSPGRKDLHAFGGDPSLCSKQAKRRSAPRPARQGLHSSAPRLIARVSNARANVCLARGTQEVFGLRGAT